jgi:phosphatidylinositol phospholipase C beta
MFAQNREDRKRVEKALDISGLPSGKVRTFCFTVVMFKL